MICEKGKCKMAHAKPKTTSAPQATPTAWISLPRATHIQFAGVEISVALMIALLLVLAAARPSAVPMFFIRRWKCKVCGFSFY